jgi:hypothetical protein
MYKIPMNNPFEADIFAAMLEEEGIPYVVVDNSSLVFDGLFQMTMGWGHVEVPEEYRDVTEVLCKNFDDYIKNKVEGGE